VALRQWLSPNLPLSRSLVSSNGQNCQFGKILKYVRFVSVAVVQTHFSPMSGLAWKADTRPGRISAFTHTGRLVLPKIADLNGCYRPQADRHNAADYNSIRLCLVHAAGLLNITVLPPLTDPNFGVEALRRNPCCGAVASMLAQGFGPIGKSTGKASTAACSAAGLKQYG
jgi:hypothetical protein